MVRRRMSFVLISAALLGGCRPSAPADPEPVQPEPNAGVLAEAGPQPSPAEAPPPVDASADELAEARRAAGFKSPEEQLAEAKALYQQHERDYIKQRLPEYRALLETLRQLAARADKPDVAFKKRLGAFRRDYDLLTEQGTRGGDAQYDLARAVDAFDELLAQPTSERQQELRRRLLVVEDELDAIEAD